MDDDNMLLEQPGEIMTDRAGVMVYRYVTADEVAEYEALGWVVASHEGSLVRMRLNAEEYFG